MGPKPRTLHVEDEPLKLQQLNEELRQSEDRYRLLLDKSKAAAAKLRESEQHLRLALAIAKLGIYERDVATGKAVYDSQLRAILGLEGEVSSPEAARKSLYPEDRKRVLGAIARALDPGIREVASAEFRIIRPDGEVRWLTGSAQALFAGEGPSGRAVKLLGVVRDITERKRAAERQAELLARVQAANRELDDFASIVSHDLKAPLRGLANLAAWLREDYADKLDAKGHEWLLEMGRRIRRMTRMIKDVLEYSRVGRSEEGIRPVALAELVPDVVQDLAPPPEARVTIAPGLPVLVGEPVRLRQVFQNLIGNAIQHAGKPEVLIQVNWVDAGEFWELSATDNGPGIDPRYFEWIFQMFRTVVPKDKTESTGVGLALVKRIVEHAGGRVWVESRPGEGSTFRFTWPKEIFWGAEARGPSPTEVAADKHGGPERMAA